MGNKGWIILVIVHHLDLGIHVQVGLFLEFLVCLALWGMVKVVWGHMTC